MVNKLKCYVWLMGEDIESSIDKVMRDYPADVADVCRIFDCTYEDVHDWLKDMVSEHEES